MVGEWVDTTIGEQATLQRGFDITKADQHTGTVPVISSGGVSSYHDTAAASGPGVILGRKGVVGSVYFIASDYWPHDTTPWVKDFHGNDRRFVYYFFKWMAPRVARMDVGSANPTLNRNHVHPIEIRWPPLPEQHAIAHILGTLDDKIELSRRMNETLEAIARALFKSWFVDFDPVRTKCRGTLQRALTLPQSVADLFPDSFKDSELGEIPAGWTTTALKNLTTKIGSGATPRGGSAVYVKEGVALIRSQNIYDYEFRWGGLARLTDRSAVELQNVEVKLEDVLINITGDSILRTCVVDPHVLPARVNQHVAIIRAALGVPPRYLHLLLVQPRMKNRLGSLDAGATRKAVTKEQLESLNVLQPPREVLAWFAGATTPLFQRIDCSRSESRTLAALRDTLLPKLISGELRVKDAEGFIGRAL
jgi:type I restriction enzyme, S subunit